MRLFALVCCMCCLFFLCLPGTVSAASVQNPAASDPAVPVDDGTSLSVDLVVVDSGDYATWEVTSQLGVIHLTLPLEVDASALIVVGDRIVNMSNSTIYLYCSEFPGYTFSASRFGPITYRESNASGYQSVELIVSDAAVVKQDPDSVFTFCVLFVIFLSAVFCFHRW